MPAPPILAAKVVRLQLFVNSLWSTFEVSYSRDLTVMTEISPGVVIHTTCYLGELVKTTTINLADIYCIYIYYMLYCIMLYILY